MKDPLTYLDIWDPLVSHQIRMKCLEWRNREDIRRSMLNTHIISKEEHEAWLEFLKDQGCESKVKLAFTNGGGGGNRHD